MLPNHSITFWVFFHWFKFRISLKLELILSRMILLSFPDSLFAGLIAACYSCMNNVKSIISKHNTRITGKSKPECEVIDPCTCRDKKTCPLQEKCMTKDIVYKATVTTSNTNSTKHYIGMTASTFKERYRNHGNSFNM